MSNLKVAIYALSKNEEKYVDKFMKSTVGADAVFITDTGSTDNTVKLLRERGAFVNSYMVRWDDWPAKSRTDFWVKKLGKPWRFDIARNASLAAIPNDFDWCICLDLDEVLHDGWRKHLEDTLIKNPNATRMRYKYIWSHNSDGSPDLIYWGDKIHARNNYKWRHPVHEVLAGSKEVQEWCDLVIEHFPDSSKSRGQYFPLLELAVFEDNEDDRNAHYLGREYFFNSMWDKAKAELLRHLSLPRSKWKAERARSMQYIAKCCLYLGERDEHINWLRRACIEDPSAREGWVDLAQAEYDCKEYLGGYYAAKQALKITNRVPSYMSTSTVWGAWPHDLAGTCASYIGLLNEARIHTELAWKLSKTDQRIIANLKYLKREHIRTDKILPRFFILNISDDQTDNWSALANNKASVIFLTLTQSFKLDDFSPNDVVIADRGNTIPPKDWDKYLFDNFTNFNGCIIVNTGENTDPIISLPILDYGCYIHLGGVIFNPSYKVHYADVELYDILFKAKLIKDLRFDGPLFQYKYIPNHDTFNEDRSNYQSRNTK